MYRPALAAVLCSLAFHCGNGEDLPDAITGACRRLAECREPSLGDTESERACGDRLTAQYDEASTQGCATAQADWVSCLSTTRGEQCSPLDPCQGLQAALASCQELAGSE
jgi:hypothetical protein